MNANWCSNKEIRNQITSININSGSVYFSTSHTSSLSASAASNFVQLSGSITYPLEIQPYYTLGSSVGLLHLDIRESYYLD